MRPLRPTRSGVILVTALALLIGAAADSRTAPRAQGGDTGSITGTVKAKPAGKPLTLRVTKDTDFCGVELPSEATLTAADGALRNAVVYLDAPASPVPTGAKGTTLALRNERCAFAPRVQAGVAGAKLTITNEDPLLHNVHLFLQTNGKRRSVLNLGLPGEVAGIDASRAVRRPGIIEVRCDAHDWMAGWMIILEHPYFAVTEREGRFSIPDVPPGTYTLRVWHEQLGELTREVVVVAGKATAVSLEYGG